MLSTERIQQTFTSMHWASAACAEQPASPQHAQMFCRLLAGWRGTVGLFTGEQRTGGGNDTRMAGSQRRRLPSAQPIVSDVSGDTCIWQTPVHTQTHTRALYHSTVEELMLRVLRKQRKHCCEFFFLSLSDKTFLTK